jgi:putative membrane protein
MMTKWSNTGELASEVWVKIEGTIDSTLLKDNETGAEIDSPVIIVNKVERIQKPENIYVYPK